MLTVQSRWDNKTLSHIHDSLNSRKLTQLRFLFHGFLKISTLDVNIVSLWGDERVTQHLNVKRSTLAHHRCVPSLKRRWRGPNTTSRGITKMTKPEAREVTWCKSLVSDIATPLPMILTIRPTHMAVSDIASMTKHLLSEDCPSLHVKIPHLAKAVT
jgi:hypothetical protein